MRIEQPAVSGLVSAIIPTFNRAHIVGRAIESVLGQTYRDIEVVVADDGSTDDTQAVVKRFGPRVTCVTQPNRGVSAARNLGMRHSRGEFIAFLDSDDRWLPWKIEAQVTALTRFATAGIVWTDMTAIDEQDKVLRDRHLRVMYMAYQSVDIARTLAQVATLGELTSSAPSADARSPVLEGDLYSAILLGNLLHTSTVLFRRACVESTGGFDESFVRTGEDYEFYVRLCSASRSIFIDAASTLYRIGAADQLTRPSMMLEIARNNLRTVQKWLPHTAASLTLSPALIRQRIAASFAWVGEAELDAGNRFAAARRLGQSIAQLPRVDRRAAMLVRCALPEFATSALRRVRAAWR